MEKELHSLLWKIDSGEISYEARRNSQISIESGVIGSLMQDNQSSSSEQGKVVYNFKLFYLIPQQDLRIN